MLLIELLTKLKKIYSVGKISFKFYKNSIYKCRINTYDFKEKTLTSVNKNGKIFQEENKGIGVVSNEKRK